VVFVEKSARKNETPDVVANISKITSEIGWKPKHPLRKVEEKPLRRKDG